MNSLNLKLPKWLETLVELAANSHSFLAGGIVRSVYTGEEISDIDIFSANQESYQQLLKDLQETKFTIKFSNPMTTRLEGMIQYDKAYPCYKKGGAIETAYIATMKSVIIDAVTPRKTEYMCSQGLPQEVISFFDFTVARAALINSTTALVDDDFVEDCKNKKLKIKHIVCPLTSVKRTAKYMSKGYTIANKEMVKLFIEWNNRQEYASELAYLLQQENPTPEQVAQLQQMVYID